MLPAVAVKLVELEPAGTVTELAGTGRVELLLDSITSSPPAGAAALNVTVHVVAAPELKVAGLQARLETGSVCPKAAAEDKKTTIPAVASRYMVGLIIIRQRTRYSLVCRSTVDLPRLQNGQLSS